MDLLARNSTTYVLCKERIDGFPNCINVGVNDLKLQYMATPVVKRHRNGTTIILMGRFVNNRDPKASNEQIVEGFLDSHDFADLLVKTRRLAGRFVLFYAGEDRLFLLPDAAASVSVAYTTGNELYVSSNPKTIADINGWPESQVSKVMKSKAEQTHPLPYDMSMYDQVKMVPPNHYLDCRKREIVRYYPAVDEGSITLADGVEKSNEILKNIIMGYHNKYKLSLPLTSGVDSRVILSLCRDIISDIPTYTFFHSWFSENTGDIVVPQRLSKTHGFEHTILKHNEMPEVVFTQLQEKMGGMINLGELQNAWTYYKSEISDRTRLDGNVSPLAKSSFGRDLPEALATPSYLTTKTHNYAKKNKQEVKRWVNDVQIHSRISKISKYDLFFWEHRVGRWTANSYLNADLLIDSLNPFNCRELIELWLRIPRVERMNGDVHKGIIELNWPELLRFPFNPDAKFGFIYKHSPLYYLGVRFKYIVQGFRYIRSARLVH